MREWSEHTREKTKQNKTKQNKTKTKQNKTKQNKTNKTKQKNKANLTKHGTNTKFRIYRCLGGVVCNVSLRDLIARDR